MKVTAFMGVIGSGKDYEAQKLIAQGAKHIGFADGVREDVWTIIGWKPKDSDEYEYFKSAMFTDKSGGITFTGRDLLLNYGTPVRRVEDFDVWCKRLVRRLDFFFQAGVEQVVITDCRFENEVKFLKEYKSAEVKFAFCDYHSFRYNPNFQHESEEISQELIKLGAGDWDSDDFDNFIYANEITKKNLQYGLVIK